ncbi:MAG: STAS domain-containing protein [Candidatus Electryonea clarkiae]|nr:STAS domain-containing protein [Candidatus Electryonea clarkiae]
MKFTSYASRIHGETAYIFGGKALDFDLGGGLEETMQTFINTGVCRIVLTMRGMKFLHSTLFAGLLAIQKQLEELGGDLILAEVPWFVQMMLEEMGLLHRFAIVPNELTVTRAENIKIDLNNVILPG